VVFQQPKTPWASEDAACAPQTTTPKDFIGEGKRALENPRRAQAALFDLPCRAVQQGDAD
jgi:hypothetical protein